MEKRGYYSEAGKRASQKYIAANLEEIKFRVKKGERANLKAAAEKAGMSATQFIIAAINAYAGTQVLSPSEKAEGK
jgi:uncharacterized protein (DUF1778 family)